MGRLFSGAGIAVGEHVSLFLKNSVEHVTSILGLIMILGRCRSTSTTGTRRPNSNISSSTPIRSRSWSNSPDISVHLPRCRFLPAAAQRPRHRRGHRTPAYRGGRTVDRGGVVLGCAYAADSADFGPRTGDDLYVLYTGGTTGYPKGVMWRHDDFFRKPLSGGNPDGTDDRQNLGEVADARRNSRSSPSSSPHR